MPHTVNGRGLEPYWIAACCVPDGQLLSVVPGRSCCTANNGTVVCRLRQRSEQCHARHNWGTASSAPDPTRGRSRSGRPHRRRRRSARHSGSTTFPPRIRDRVLIESGCWSWRASRRPPLNAASPRELTRAHRHRWMPDDRVCRRAAFHTSPQSPHRQYACSSRLRAVVEIELDRHAGHTVGMVISVVDVVRSPKPFPNFDGCTGDPSRKGFGEGWAGTA